MLTILLAISRWLARGMVYDVVDIPGDVMVIKPTPIYGVVIESFMAIVVKRTMTSRIIHHLTAISEIPPCISPATTFTLPSIDIDINSPLSIAFTAAIFQRITKVYTKFISSIILLFTVAIV